MAWVTSPAGPGLGSTSPARPRSPKSDTGPFVRSHRCPALPRIAVDAAQGTGATVALTPPARVQPSRSSTARRRTGPPKPSDGKPTNTIWGDDRWPATRSRGRSVAAHLRALAAGCASAALVWRPLHDWSSREGTRSVRHEDDLRGEASGGGASA